MTLQRLEVDAERKHKAQLAYKRPSDYVGILDQARINREKRAGVFKKDCLDSIDRKAKKDVLNRKRSDSLLNVDLN